MTGSTPADDISFAGESRSARLGGAVLCRAVPVRMWGGSGCGAPCDFCRATVGPSDVEFEVEAEIDGTRILLRFHARCHDEWAAGHEPATAKT
jgi:hypothetical protein